VDSGPGGAWRLGVVTVIAAVLALCNLQGAVAHPASASARPLITGISGIGEYEPTIFEHTRSTGAQLVRLGLYWDAVAPSQQPAGWNPENPADPNYNWTYMDRGVTEAVRAGLNPVLLVDGAPAWAQRCTPPAIQAGGGLCDPDPAALAAFAKAAATRYSGHFGGLPRVQYWQGLNEPNLSLFFFPQYDGNRAVSPTLYRALINSFYAGIKSVDPSDLVIAAGLGPIAVPKYTVGPMRFARELLCMQGHTHPRPLPGGCDGGVHFDIFDIHPYTSGGPTHEGGVNDVELGDLGKVAPLLRAADRAGHIVGQFKHTPIWCTEFSWDSNPPDPGGLPMKILSRWAAEALYRSWRAGISRFFWYSLRDDPPHPNQPFSQTLQSGLYFRGPTPEQDQPKEVLSVFKFPFVAYPGDKGLSFWGRTPTSQPGKVAIQLWRDGKWRRSFSTRADRTGIFQGLVPGDYGRGHRGSARAVFGGETSVPFSMKPVRDFRQPPFG
jgi:hypothetical protein